MTQSVDVPGVGTVDFPDGMASSDMAAAIQKNFPQIHSRSLLDRIGALAGAPAEAGLHVASEIAAFPVEGVASAYQLMTAPKGQKVRAANAAMADVAGAMTYQPGSPEGGALARGADTLLSLPGRAADAAGGAVTRATGSAGLGAATDLALQAAPAVLGGEALTRAGASTASAETAAAVARARTYMTRNGIDWGSLTDSFKSQLATLAKEPGRLEKLNLNALQRVARAQSFGAPITRGQATRDLSQITHEENLSRSESGKPLRDISTQQDVALHDRLDTLRAQTGGSAQTRLQLGESVQGAERAKLQTLSAERRRAYVKAREAGEMQGHVDVTPLQDWLEVPANKRNAGYLKSALQDYSGDGSISINDLEKVRQEVNVKVRSRDGVEAHYARDAVKQIDGILDSVSNNGLYKQARAAFAAEKAEFDRQGLIKKLTSERTKTTDRAVALEDTFDTTVRRGTQSQLLQLRDSLLKGGTAQTRARGAQAWKDVQAATIDHLKDAAAGRRAIRGEDEQLQFNSSFIDAVDELDKDGKLDVIFGEQARGVIRQLRDATRDLRTKPADRVAGPNTTPRLVALLDKLASVPGVGHTVVGAAKFVKRLHDLGREGAEVRRAVEPLSSARDQPPRRVLPRAAAAAPFTLQDLSSE